MRVEDNMGIKWNDAKTEVRHPDGTTETHAKQPDETAWSIEQDERIRNGEPPQTFEQWKRRSGLTGWDNLDESDRRLIARREAYNKKKWAEQRDK